MNEIECPACAGPDEARQGCATCGGVMQVTQETFDAFMAEKAKQEETNTFWAKVSEHMYNPGKYTFQFGEEVFNLDN